MGAETDTGVAVFLFAVDAVSNGLVFGDMDNGDPGMFSSRAEGSSS